MGSKYCSCLVPNEKTNSNLIVPGTEIVEEQKKNQIDLFQVNLEKKSLRGVNNPSQSGIRQSKRNSLNINNKMYILF